eukprot:TRINITY_DN11746_c0_g1_i1.p1 TRINITY_DN11746_c0_g1~~TRINITY_DN11746_c0_g1_i1.p1  ORF type:complete len:195 (+),score=33.31 TRINITY_DN11746_c0_g1_i1:2-586(+)
MNTTIIFALCLISLTCVVTGKSHTGGMEGEPFLFCDLNQKFSEGFGTVDSYNIAYKNKGLVEPDLIPEEGVGSSIYWWSQKDEYIAKTGIQWDRCFTVFSKYQNRDYIDYHKQMALIDVKIGSMRLNRFNPEDLECRQIDNQGSNICKAAPGKEIWSMQLDGEGDLYIHNSSVPHSVTFLSPYILRTVCFLNIE